MRNDLDELCQWEGINICFRELDTLAVPGARGADNEMNPVEYFTCKWSTYLLSGISSRPIGLVDSLVARIANLEDELARSQEREAIMRDLLTSTEIVLFEYKGLYFQARDNYENASDALNFVRRDCGCCGGCTGRS